MPSTSAGQPDPERFVPLDLLGDGLHGLALVIDDTGTIVYANAACDALLGYAPEALVGEDCVGVLWNGDTTVAHAVLAAASGRERENVRACLHRDGTWRTFAWRTRQTTGGDGRSLWLLHAHETSLPTGRGEVGCQAHRMQALGLGALAIAHNFGNLLTVIKGYAELIQLELSRSAGVGELVPAMAQGVQRAEQLVQRLLRFAKSGEDREPTACDANAVIDDLFSILALLAGRGIRTSCALDATRARVTLDRCSLEQVLLNLCANARDAMPEGGTLHLSTFLLDGGEPSWRSGSRQRLVIEVTDTGCGMPEDVRTRAFEPFFTTKRHGTGLGLETARRLVEGAGGRVDLASTPGHGTTFRVRLPLADDSPTLIRLRRSETSEI